MSPFILSFASSNLSNVSLSFANINYSENGFNNAENAREIRSFW
jgi:hypothetical protein